MSIDNMLILMIVIVIVIILFLCNHYQNHHRLGPTVDASGDGDKCRSAPMSASPSSEPRARTPRADMASNLEK